MGNLLAIVISDPKPVVLMVCSAPFVRLRNTQELVRNACFRSLLLDH